MSSSEETEKMWYSGVGALHNLMRGIMLFGLRGAYSPGLGSIGARRKTLGFSCGRIDDLVVDFRCNDDTERADSPKTKTKSITPTKRK